MALFNKGDFVLVEYTVRVKETGNLVDTTDEELAKRENAYEEGKIYGPTLLIIGRNWINGYVEDEIAKMEVGEERVIEVPPEKAFGERDPKKIKILSLREFKRRGVEVRVGDVVELSEGQGIVKGIEGGRVIVDLNHPLAGKTLVYKVKVVGKLDNLLEKARKLAVRHLRIPEGELAISYNEAEKALVLSIPTKYMTRRDLGYSKLALATDVMQHLSDGVTKVVFQEVIERRASQGGQGPPEPEGQAKQQ
ncbi:MAG: peptidylprolyl isomerase [Desulfurococcaceae archaeon]